MANSINDSDNIYAGMMILKAKLKSIEDMNVVGVVPNAGDRATLQALIDAAQAVLVAWNTSLAV